MRRKKLYAAVSLFVIGFTLMILMIFVVVVEQFRSNAYPEQNNSRLLVTSVIKVIRKEHKGGWSGSLNYSFINKYLGEMHTPKYIGTTTLTRTEDIYPNNKRQTIRIRGTDNGFWSIMKFKFVSGRPFNADEVTNEQKEVVISQKLAKEVFSNDPVGKTIRIYDENFRICGVVKDVNRDRIFSYADVWMPVTLLEKNHNIVVKSRSNCFGGSIGLVLADKKSDINKIKDEFNAILSQVEKESDIDHFDLKLEPSYYAVLTDFTGLKTHQIKLAIPTLFLLLSLIYIIMPSVNLYSLQKVRFYERASEIGVRKTFGADIITLKRQFLAENIIITCMGGILGFALTQAGILIINHLQIFTAYSIHFGFMAVLISIMICIVFGFLSGLVSSVRLSKLSTINALNLSQL